MDHRSDGTIDTKEWAAIAQNTADGPTDPERVSVVLSTQEALIRFAEIQCSNYELGLNREEAMDVTKSWLPVPETGEDFILFLTSSTVITHMASFMCFDNDPGRSNPANIPDVGYEPEEVPVDILAVT